MAIKKTANKKSARRRLSLSRQPIVRNVRAVNYAESGDQYIDMRSQSISLPIFLADLQKAQKEISALKQQPALDASEREIIKQVEAKMAEGLHEASKPKPLPARINRTLAEASEMMGKISSSVQKAIELGGTLALLAELALKLKLFGG